MSGIEVLRTGSQTLIEDLGRPGLAAIGVSRSGVADLGAYKLGARLLGHDFSADGPRDPGPAALEVLLGGLEFRVHGELTIALTGAAVPATQDGRLVDANAPIRLRDRQVLRLGSAERGLRCYVSFRGGLDVEPVLGSRSRDTLAELGPLVEPGSFLPVGAAQGQAQPLVDHAAIPALPDAVVDVDFLPGPRADWLADLGALTSTSWLVSERSNRVGVRLVGEPLARATQFDGAELPSEGVVRGTIQVPPGGEPVVFLSDHPVTGGYPSVGVLTRAAADRAAQARPGQRIRLQPVSRKGQP
ncbi:MAG: biotin-dependent carboxyltransferase family protein [Micrococcales bacterium]|nr:biotin-dependent carboxyltransferase family protein [Micrococcales bacterium]